METCFTTEEHNVLLTALQNAAKSYGQELYDYIEEVPKASLIVELIDELHLLGYEICKKQKK